MFKVLSVSGHGCIRATKMNIALMGKGHEVHLAAKRVVPFAINYKSNVVAQDYNQMREAFKIYEQHVDLCHAHNEPSWYVTLWREVSDKPVILDVHDSCLARVTPEEWEKQNSTMGCHNVRVSAEERNNFQLADALVFPAYRFKELIVSEFGLKTDSIVLPSYVPRHFYSYFPLEWQGGLVYEGKVALEKEVPMFNYCDYRELARQAATLEMDFHIYPAGYVPDLQKIYKGEEMKTTYIHTPTLLDDLIKRLGRHDWGLVGNITKTSEWDHSLPNKLFEYMAAGTPVAVINSDECADFVEKHKVGIVVKDLAELGQRWGEHREIRNALARIRMDFCMENRIHELEALYERVLQ